MKKWGLVLVLGLVLLGITHLAMAGQIEEYYNFYDRYDPASTTFVYDSSASTSTGNQVAVNTYTQKTIQISPIIVNEYMEIRIEGRIKDQVNTPNWAVLDTWAFGKASADTSKNAIIDVTEYIDFIRVGIRQLGTNAASAVDIKGIFTNLDR